MIKTINLAYYQEQDWERFLEIIDDRNKMHDTWQAWNKAYLKLKKELTLQGFIVKKTVVDLDELQNYCSLRGIKNDGKARSQFVSNR